MNEKRETATNQNGVEIDITTIHDLWHIAKGIKDGTKLAKDCQGLAGEMVLDVWHQAHAMRDEIRVLRDRLQIHRNMISRMNQSATLGDES